MGKITIFFKQYSTALRYDILNSTRWYYQCVNPFYRLLRGTILFVVSSVYRRDRLTELYYRKQVFQPNSYTNNNRYPELFKIVQNYFINRQQLLKLCSFGCSTGSEIVSLLNYFPQALIIGVDINQYNLKVCRENIVHGKTSFFHSLSNDWLQSDKFDAIFCLAVLQHTYNRNPNNAIAKKFTFEKFDKQICQFDDKLKVGGLLILDHCDFSFSDTTIYPRYCPLEVENNFLIRQRPWYDKQNHRKGEIFASFRVFKKLS